MRPKIYLDMDGVMTDFVGAVLRTWPRKKLLDPLGHRPEPPSSFIWSRPMDESDIDAWAIEDRLGVSREDFWRTIDQWSWWNALEAYPWATPLFEMLSFYGDVTYLTSPARSPGAAAGKLSWIQARHGKEFSDWIFTNHKEHVAGPGKILIDDSEKNCEAWQAAGGTAILFPQYWNEDRRTRFDYPKTPDWKGPDIQRFIRRVEVAVNTAVMRLP